MPDMEVSKTDKVPAFRDYMFQGKIGHKQVNKVISDCYQYCEEN